MDLDAFVAAHLGEWRELDQLAARSRLTASEADRLVDLYQAVATHLSYLRTTSPDPALVVSLSSLLARARRRAGRDRVASFTTITTFFADTFPAALYRLRWWWLTTMVASLALAFAVGGWLVAHPERLAAVGTSAELNHLANHDFADYYRTYEASHFALQVWTNNAWLALEAVAFGVLGLPVLYLLWNNMLNVAVMAAVLITHHKAWLFWSLITPHGLLELTAVFVACGAGLRLFWSWVEPGARTRTASMAHEGRTTVLVALGCGAVLAVSGLLEAFITPSPLPGAVRVFVGVVAWAAFLGYALVLGRRRAGTGIDGDVERAEQGDHTIAVD